ncbi:energy transducer TonB [Flavobacterium aquidurense]|uniref:energy transducer TonB n=1 Tax=Flavobacterium aquidurense TaxID=362413 RepID=UPI0028658CA3|nr:energy transducer TonB [Flavobacterium aquidurense]MDR7369414.1 antitoxin component YwqK of YwqJK toxin-antitoxin module [Flavobacterium aquidurense]
MKNHLFTRLLLFVSIASFSQIIKPTRYNLDSLRIPTIKQDFKYIRLVENYDNRPNVFLFTEYTREGKITMRAISTKKDEQKFEGPRIDYYENGNIKQESNYIDNKLSGTQIDYYENNDKKTEKEITWNPEKKISSVKILQFWNKDKQQTVVDGNGIYEDTEDDLYEKGEIKKGEKQGIWEGKDLKKKINFTENYNEGVLISGISTDENNNLFPYKEILEKPFPAKGMQNFYKHIGRNYSTPKVEGLKGKIYITFVIDEDGDPTNFRVLRDIGYGTGLEGIKVIASYGKWIPGKMRGIPEKVMYSLPITVQASTNPFQYNNNSSQRSNDPFQQNNNSFR